MAGVFRGGGGRRGREERYEDEEVRKGSLSGRVL
jgi:hypothetical protein